MENRHAARYHMHRILGQLADEAAQDMASHPFGSELSALGSATSMSPEYCGDEEMVARLRHQIKSSARLLLMMQRRTGDFG